MPPERTSRSSTTRHSVISENTPPHLFKKLNPRLHGPSRTALANRKRGASNIFMPTTLRPGVYQAEVAKKRQSVKTKVEPTAQTPTPTPAKDLPKPHDDSSSLPPWGDSSMEADANGPYIFKFVRPSPFFKSEFMGERPFNVEIADDLATSLGPQGDIRLPKKLQRAPYKSVTREAIMAVSPELVDIPYTFLIERVWDYSKSWFPGLRNVKVSFDKSALPDTFDVLVKEQTSPPTHILAVKPIAQPSHTKPSQPCPVKLYPVHSMVMAFHCRYLPPFSPGPGDSKPDCTSEDSSRLTLPCRYLSLPHPETFPFILGFLYTQNKATFLKALLPMPAPPNVVDNQLENVRGFGTRLGRTVPPERILQSIFFTHMVWMNTLALGIVDDAYWECLDIAWETLLCGFAVATGQPEVMGLLP